MNRRGFFGLGMGGMLAGLFGVKPKAVQAAADWRYDIASGVQAGAMSRDEMRQELQPRDLSAEIAALPPFETHPGVLWRFAPDHIAYTSCDRTPIRGGIIVARGVWDSEQSERWRRYREEHAREGLRFSYVATLRCGPKAGEFESTTIAIACAADETTARLMASAAIHATRAIDWTNC